MLSEGHVEAHRYPLSSLWEEVEIATDRQNRASATQAVLVQNAVSSLLDTGSSKTFRVIIERLNDDGSR